MAQRSHVIGKNQPANPKAIVYMSCMMIGVHNPMPTDMYEAMLEVSRELLERTVSKLIKNKKLVIAETEFRGPKFFAFGPNIGIPMEEHMKNMCKTVVQTKKDTGLRVYGAEVMVHSPILAAALDFESTATYCIHDPSTKSCKQYAAQAQGDVIDFSAETALNNAGVEAAEAALVQT